MKKMKFVNLGEKDPSDLDFQHPILYSSESLISSMSYSGPATKILDSTAFTDTFKEKLIGITGQVSLGSTGRELRNVHVYSRKAERLDGIERICYLQQQDHQLVISEYSGNRGSKYSALYKIFVESMRIAGFKDTQNKFKIEESDIPKFVKVINEVIDLRDSGAYELVPIHEVDSLIIEKQRYYYFKAYWQPLDLSAVPNVYHEEDAPSRNVDEALRVLLQHSMNCNDKEELMKLAEKIEKLGSNIEARIRNLEDFETLYSEL